jgi:hypothetical protein
VPALATLVVSSGTAIPSNEQLGVAADVLDRIGRERLELLGKSRLGVLHRCGDGLVVLHRALGHDLLAQVESLAVEADGLAVGHAVEDISTRVVNQRDAGLHEQLRPEIGVTPADARRGVHDGGHLAPDQGLRAHPVQVGMIDNRDVAALEPLGEILGPSVQTSRR